MKPPRVLLVEDSSVQAQVIQSYLHGQGYPVQVASTVQAGCSKATQADVVVLDVVLPDGSGFEVLEHILTLRLPVKVLMLSELGSVPDRVRGLKSGADGYLPKPFNLTELAARIEALWRQARPLQMLHVGNWILNTENLTVDLGYETVQLTSQEMQVLLKLAEQPGMPLSREDIFRSVWKNDEGVGMRILDVRIHGLRQKLGEHTIHTVRGLGYSLMPPGIQV